MSSSDEDSKDDTRNGHFQSPLMVKLLAAADRLLEIAEHGSTSKHLLGMISHKKSLITNFGHKLKIKNFIKKLDIFHEKISMAFEFWSIFGIKFLILNLK